MKIIVYWVDCKKISLLKASSLSFLDTWTLGTKMFKCSSWIYAWVPLPGFLFEDWFVIITLKFHYQLGIFRAILKMIKQERCICVYVCVLVRETLKPLCENTMYMCKGGSGAWIATKHSTIRLLILFKKWIINIMKLIW